MTTIGMRELSGDTVDLQAHYEAMQDDLYDGVTAAVVEGTRQALAWGQAPVDILARGLVAGMDIVGKDFGDGILFVPEVLRAANAMKAAMEILRPLLTQTGAPKAGIAVIGTVKGDIHDIGKNLVAMMWEGAGFEVHNLGNNVDADKFIAAIREHHANLLGMSALLTTTMPYMATVIERLHQEGLRDHVKVLVGGAPLNAAFAEDIGADRYCKDAAEGVAAARALIRRET
ncbi:MAG: cobalamin-binding protein [Chloroflexi bacterium]|nr:cobalamin-binding protein [Chloroflexota bacterium]